MKRIGKVSVILLSLWFLISCMDVNLNDHGEGEYAESETWMSRIGDEVFLKDIAIPGTHDSCANYDFLGISSTAAAQDYNLNEQLNCGVRFFDIRPCKIGNTMMITHGPTVQNITLDEVFTVFINFLKSHQTETIIVGILPEYLDKDDFSNVYDYLRDVSNNAAINDYFIMDKDLSTITLGECRKKIVIIPRVSGIQNTMSDVFCSNYYEYGVSYKTQNLSEAWESFVYMINNASNIFHSCFLSCYYEGQFGIPNIRIASSYLNSELEEYLDSDSFPMDNIGVVVCDHITSTISFKIYSKNISD